MWHIFAIFAVIGIVLVVFFYHRILALVLAAVARKKGLLLTIETFTITAASGIRVRLNKGPIKSVFLGSVRLGWNSSGHGAAQGMPPWACRLKVVVTDIRVNLRSAKEYTSGAKVWNKASLRKSDDASVPGDGSDTGTGESAASSRKEKAFKMPMLGFLQMLSIDVINLKVCDDVDESELLILGELHLLPHSMHPSIDVQRCTLLPPTSLNDSSKPLICFGSGLLRKESLEYPSWVPRRRSDSRSCPNSTKWKVDFDTVASHADLQNLRRAQSILKATFVNRDKKSAESSQEFGKRGMQPTHSRLSILQSWLHGMKNTQVEFSFSLNTFDFHLTTPCASTAEIHLEKGKWFVELAALESQTGKQLTSSLSWGSAVHRFAMVEHTSSALELLTDASRLDIDITTSPAALIDQSYTRRRDEASSSERSSDIGDDLAKLQFEVQTEVVLNNMHTKIVPNFLAETVETSVRYALSDGDDSIFGSAREASHIRQGHTLVQFGGNATTASDTVVNEKKPSWQTFLEPYWKLDIKIGQGSSLQFLSEELDCIWMSTLDSATTSIGRRKLSEKAAASSSTIGFEFEARNITMTTWMPPSFKIPHSNWDIAPDRVLSTSHVRINWQRSEVSSSTTLDDPLAGSTSRLGVFVDEVYAVLLPSFLNAFGETLAATKSLMCSFALVKRHKAGSTGGDRRQEKKQQKALRKKDKALFQLSLKSHSLMVVTPSTDIVSQSQSCNGKSKSIYGAVGFLVDSMDSSFDSRTRDTSIHVDRIQGVHCEGFKIDTATLDPQELLRLSRCTFVDVGAVTGTHKVLEHESDGMRSLNRSLVFETLSVSLDFDAISCGLHSMAEALNLINIMKSSARNLRSAEIHSEEDALNETQKAIGQNSSNQMCGAVSHIHKSEDEDSSRETSDTGKVLMHSGPILLEGCNVNVSLPVSADMEVSLVLSSVKGDIYQMNEASFQYFARVSNGKVCLKGEPILQIDSFAGTLATQSPQTLMTQESKENAPLSSVLDQETKMERYERAGLYGWMDRSSVKRRQSDQMDPDEAKVLGDKPASIATVSLSGVEICVPYDREPGPTMRYAQMYVKAMKQAMVGGSAYKSLMQKLSRKRYSLNGFDMKDSTTLHPKEKGSGFRMFPIEIQLKASDVSLRFEHHPLESFMATHGALLQQFALQRHLWEEAAESAMPTEQRSEVVEDSNHLEIKQDDTHESQEYEDDSAPKSPFSQATYPESAGEWRDEEKSHHSGYHQAARSQNRSSLWSPLMADLSSQYIRAVDIMRSNMDKAGSDALNVTIRHVDGIVVALAAGKDMDSDDEGIERENSPGNIAARFVRRVDKDSSRVRFLACRKLHIDLFMHGAAVRLACGTKPLVSIQGLQLSGALAVAQQATAPAETFLRKIPLGMHRIVPLTIAARGTRAPGKLYTDLDVKYEKLNVCFSPGFDPAFVVTGLAGKRMVLRDPDKNIPKLAAVPWWDELRYLWRGRAHLTGSNFSFLLGVHHHPAVNHTTERVSLASQSLSLLIDDGEHTFSFRNASCTFFSVSNLTSDLGGGAPLILPLFNAGYLSMRVRLCWKLPNGLQPSQHHLFPEDPSSLDRQDPISVAALYKSEGLDVTLDISLSPQDDSKRSKERGLSNEVDVHGSGQFFTTTESMQKESDSPAVICLGDHQVSFIRRMIAVLRSTPPNIRAIAKRGTFFCKKPVGGPPKKNLPRLLETLQLCIHADAIDLLHYTVQEPDPSSSMRLHALKSCFEASWLLNQPVASFLLLPQHIQSKQRVQGRRRTTMKDFSARFDTVTVWNEGVSNAKSYFSGISRDLSEPLAADASGQSQQPPSFSIKNMDGSEQDLRAGKDLHALIRRDLSTEDEESLIRAEELLKHLVDVPVNDQISGGEKILDAEFVTLGLNKAPPEGSMMNSATDTLPGDDEDEDMLQRTFCNQRNERPLRVVIADCHFMVDQYSRMAVWGAISHLVAAFSSRPKADPLHRTITAVPPHLLHSSSPSPSPSWMTPSSSIPRREAASELQRRLSSSTPLNMRNSSRNSEALPESNELLDMLLKEREAKGSSGSGASQRLPDESQNVEGDTEAVDGTEKEDEMTENPMSTPLDDLNSTLKYEINVVNLQVMLLPQAAVTASGRLLLAARNGLLRGMVTSDCLSPLYITTLGLDSVQAYVALTDIDPHVGLQWLQINASDGAFIAPSENDPGALRRVFSPINIDLRHSKSQSSGIATQRTLTHRSPLGTHRTTTPGGIPSASTSMKSEELLLKIPEIAAVMDGREFEVLAEVVSLLLAPGPAIDTVYLEEKLLIESENDVVEDARQLFALARQHAYSLRHEAFELRQFLLEDDSLINLTRKEAFEMLRRGGTMDRDVARESEGESLALRSREGMPLSVGVQAPRLFDLQEERDASSPPRSYSDVLGDLRHVLLQQSGNSRSAAGTDDLVASDAEKTSRPSAVRRSEHADATTGASAVHTDSTDKKAGEMSSLKAVGSGIQQKAFGVLVEWVMEEERQALETYDHARASLLAMKAEAAKQLMLRAASRVLLKLDRVVWQLCTAQKQPFVQTSLKGIVFDRHRNRDHSGSAKFLIHRIEILDATGMLPEGPATPPGVILTVWNPDSTYERDPILRIVATMGIPTATYTVFQHLDATLHPLSVHLTESIAVACWEYFFPKEDSKTRQEQFAQSVSLPSHRGKRSMPSEAAASSSQPALADITSSSSKRATAESQATPTKLRHAGGSGDMALAMSTVGSTAESAANTPSSVAAQRQQMHQFVRESSDLHSSKHYSTIKTESFKSVASTHSRSEVQTRKRKRFVYVKLNRAHLRITYQGYPIGIKDRILVVNSYTCENLEGRWRDLLANVKQKAILSAVWSGLGLQGRKIKELMEGATPTVAPPSPGDLKSNSGGGNRPGGLLARIGIGKSKGDSSERVQYANNEELKNMQKKRALFGDQLLKTMSKNRVPTLGAPLSSFSSKAPGSVRKDDDGGGGGDKDAQGTTTAPSQRQSSRGREEDSRAHGPASADSISGGRQHRPNASVDDSTPSTVSKQEDREQSLSRKPVPKLDLCQPLPPEDSVLEDVPQDDPPRRSGGTSLSPSSKIFASPLQAGLHAVSRAGAAISNVASGDGRQQKDPATKLLGKRASTYHRGESHDEDAVVTQLLGQGSPRKGHHKWLK